MYCGKTVALWLKAQQRTKSSGTISTLSSCSIDLHVGHGTPFLSPMTLPLSPQDYTCHLISPSLQSGLNKSITSFFAAWLYWRPQPLWGKSMCFSQITLLSVSLVQSYGGLSKLAATGKIIFYPIDGTTFLFWPKAMYPGFILISFFFWCQFSKQSIRQFNPESRNFTDK